MLELRCGFASNDIGNFVKGLIFLQITYLNISMGSIFSSSKIQRSNGPLSLLFLKCLYEENTYCKIDEDESFFNLIKLEELQYENF